MKVICPISGLAVYKSNYLLGFDLKDLHPIFRAKRKLILNDTMIHKFMQSDIFEEKKLIFLAVLNSTELVEFQTPAMPALGTVETHFLKLMHTAGWLAHAEYTYKAVASFPRFVVRPDTADLTSLPAWINAVEDVKDMVIRRDLDRDRAAELSNKADQISTEIRQAASLHRNFTPSLARWALDFANLNREDTRFSKWMKMMCIPTSEAWMFDIDDYKELVGFMEEELPSEHPQVLSVMFQVRELVKECKRGFTELSVFNDLDDEATESFNIIEDSPVSTGEAISATTLHAMDKPIAKNYPSKVAFLVADAKWRLAQRKLGGGNV